MSASVLYHMQGVRGHRYCREKMVAGGMEIYVDVPDEKLRCPECGSQIVWRKGHKTRKFRADRSQGHHDRHGSATSLLS